MHSYITHSLIGINEHIRPMLSVDLAKFIRPTRRPGERPKTGNDQRPGVKIWYDISKFPRSSPPLALPPAPSPYPAQDLTLDLSTCIWKSSQNVEIWRQTARGRSHQGREGGLEFFFLLFFPFDFWTFLDTTVQWSTRMKKKVAFSACLCGLGWRW